MSETKKTEEATLQVNTQDVESIEKFMDHFKFTRSKEYIAAIEKFKASTNNSVAQREAIYEIAKAFAALKGQNELVDDIFADVFPVCGNVSYHLQFEKDLEDIIGVDPAAPKTDPVSDS